METTTKIKNGIYRRSSSIFVVKDDKIMMQANGKFYKVTLDTMIGSTFESDLTPNQMSQFETLYLNARIW